MPPRLKSISKAKVAASKASKTDWRTAPQIPNIAFNTFGYGFTAPDNYLETPIYINAKNESSTTYNTVLENPEISDKPRLALDLTEKEAASEPPEGLQQYLLVGWVPRSLEDLGDAGTTQRAAYLSNNVPVGVMKPPKGALLTFDPDDIDDLPLMAVVKITDDEDPESKVRTYVLLRQKDDTCTPYVANQKDIFYLAAYRDNTTAGHKRGGKWNQLVKKDCMRSTNRPKTEKQRRYERARDQSKLILSPSLSLKNEITSLVAGYKQSKDPWFLDELQQVLVEIDQDLMLSPSENSSMLLFGLLDDNDVPLDETDSVETFTFSRARAMVTELSKMYTELDCSAERLFLLHHGVRHAQLSIDYALLQPFLAEALYQLNKAIEAGVIAEEYDYEGTHHGEDQSMGEMEDVDNTMKSKYEGQHDVVLAEVVTQAFKTVKRVLGSKPPVSISLDEEGAILRIIKEKLKEMVSTDSEFGKMLKNSAGDAAFDFTIQDIWAKHGDSCDTDAARAAFMDVVRLLISAFRQKERHLATAAEEIVQVLERAGY